MNNNTLPPPLWLLQRRRQMMAKKGGSPFGDAFAAEFDCTERVTIPITSSLNTLVKVTLDGQAINNPIQNMQVDVEQGHHVVTLELASGILTEYVLPSVDSLNAVNGKIYNRITYFTANFVSWNLWALFRSAPFYHTDKCNIYAKIPPIYNNDDRSPVMFLGGIGEIHVPKGTAEAYKAAPVWGDYKTKIIDDL